MCGHTSKMSLFAWRITYHACIMSGHASKMSLCTERIFRHACMSGQADVIS